MALPAVVVIQRQDDIPQPPRLWCKLACKLREGWVRRIFEHAEERDPGHTLRNSGWLIRFVVLTVEHPIFQSDVKISFRIG